MNYLLVFLGGGLGAAARYGVNVGVGRINPTEFPWHTLIINITGCFIMGVLTEAMALRFNASTELRLFLTTGIMGGYTTFSAFALDYALLFERKDFMSAGIYVLASVIGALLACFAGLAVVRALWA